MGRDIHLHVEYKERKDGLEYHSSFYGEFKERNYSVFDNIMSEYCVGLPDDISDYTKYWYDKWGGDAHDAGFIDSNDLAMCLYDAERENNKVDIEWYALVGYMRKLEEKKKDVRAVFWFDN